MDSVRALTTDQSQRAGVVSRVRNRWRLKRALRGATVTVAVGFIVLAASAYATRALHYSDPAIWIFRIVSLSAIVASAFRFIVTSVRATPPAARVALYIEEHERSLDGAVVTAVDAQAPSSAFHTAVTRSPALVARLLRFALDRMRRVDGGRAVDASDLQRTSIVFAAVSAAA